MFKCLVHLDIFMDNKRIEQIKVVTNVLLLTFLES